MLNTWKNALKMLFVVYTLGVTGLLAFNYYADTKVKLDKIDYLEQTDIIILQYLIKKSNMEYLNQLDALIDHPPENWDVLKKQNSGNKTF